MKHISLSQFIGIAVAILLSLNAYLLWGMADRLDSLWSITDSAKDYSVETWRSCNEALNETQKTQRACILSR